MALMLRKEPKHEQGRMSRNTDIACVQCKVGLVSCEKGDAASVPLQCVELVVLVHSDIFT